RPALSLGEEVSPLQRHLDARSEAAPAEARLGESDQQAAFGEVVRGADPSPGDGRTQQLGEAQLRLEVHRRRASLLDAVEEPEIGRAAEFRAVLTEEDDAVPLALEPGLGPASLGMTPTMATAGVG